MRLYHAHSFMAREINIYDGNDVKSSLHITVHQSVYRDGEHIIERREKLSSYKEALELAHKWHEELYEQSKELRWKK